MFGRAFCRVLGCAESGRRFSAVDSFVGIPLLYVVVKAIVDENLGIPDDGKFIFVKLPKGRLYDGVMHNGCGSHCFGSCRQRTLNQEIPCGIIGCFDRRYFDDSRVRISLCFVSSEKGFGERRKRNSTAIGQ